VAIHAFSINPDDDIISYPTSSELSWPRYLLDRVNPDIEAVHATVVYMAVR
jgi:hypothetical protein